MLMTANKSASKKQKGSRLERFVAEAYRHHGIDKDAKRMPLSGAFDGLKGDIFKPHDKEWVDECKNQEKVKLWEFWEQAKSQARGLQRPLLHVSGNYREVLTVMKLDDYMHLRQCERQLEELLDEQQKGMQT
jgi:hypothetical protein